MFQPAKNVADVLGARLAAVPDRLTTLGFSGRAQQADPGILQFPRDTLAGDAQRCFGAVGSSILSPAQHDAGVGDSFPAPRKYPFSLK